MVKERKEYFVIKDCSGEYNSVDAEWFDTFEEARSHINDSNEHGNYRYTGWYTDSRECEIERRVVGGKQKRMVTLDSWNYRDGRLNEEYSYHWSSRYGEPEYEGKVW